MRILARGIVGTDFSGQFFTISKDDNTLLFQLGENSIRAEAESESQETIWHGKVLVNLLEIFKKRTSYCVYGISKIDSNKRTIINLSEPINAKVGERGFAEDLVYGAVFPIMEKTPLIVLYFHDTAEDVTIVINRDVDLAGSTVPVELVQNGKTLPEILLEDKPDFAAYQTIRTARQKLIRAAEPNMALAYLEAQLDIVTKLLLLALDKNNTLKTDVAQGFPQLQQFEDVFNTSNLLTVKTVDKCLSELVENKTRLRGLQSSYYAVKAANGE